ncbi:MAG: hypothetical protein HYX53_12315 [Chloroflexi bacterium]|nr:hypothetical protein [Chloroflexota bacterium]
MTQQTEALIQGRPETLPALQRIDQYAKALDRAVQLTQIADAKAAPVLALQATLAAVTVSQSSAVGQLLDAGQHSGFVIVLAAVLLLAYAGTGIFAGVLGVLVYLPRAPRPGQAGRSEPASLIYFDDIRRMPRDLFLQRASQQEFAAFERDIMTQVHTVSGVAALKMGYVRAALLATIVTFAAWLPLIAWAQA